MIKELSEAFVLGITYGLGPCTLSCAPLIVPLIMAAAKNKTWGVILSIIFGLGRIIAYVILGALSGFIGQTLNFSIPNRVTGIFIILLGIFLFFNIHNKCILKSKIKINGPIVALVVGFVWGLSPCQPLIALLGLTVLTKSMLTGALMALVFGLGTIISPIIILGFFSGWFAKQKEFKEIIPYVSGLFLILMGILYLF
jgi:sulfite exporter TauE/SafE